jgi:hypothetical protein
VNLSLLAYSSRITLRILRIMFPMVNSDGATNVSSFPIALRVRRVRRSLMKEEEIPDDCDHMLSMMKSTRTQLSQRRVR